MKSGPRRLIWIFHLVTEAQKFGPSFVAVPGTLAGRWIRSESVGTLTSVHTECWCYRRQLIPLCHNVKALLLLATQRKSSVGSLHKCLLDPLPSSLRTETGVSELNMSLLQRGRNWSHQQWCHQKQSPVSNPGTLTQNKRHVNQKARWLPTQQKQLLCLGLDIWPGNWDAVSVSCRNAWV